jgi:hypothetical protein
MQTIKVSTVSEAIAALQEVQRVHGDLSLDRPRKDITDHIRRKNIISHLGDLFYAPPFPVNK